MMPSNIHDFDDDKYAKFNAVADNSKACDSIQHRSKFGVLNNVVEAVPWHLFTFACFVLATGFAYTLVGVPLDIKSTERFSGLQLEILGLVVLREKIKSRKSVSGISGMTFMMYAMVYFCRTIVALPPWWLPGVFDKDFKLKDLDLDVTLGFCSFLLVLDILKSVFLTHRETYEEEWDVLKAWYLIPACWFTSLLLRPQFMMWSFIYSWGWSSTLYMDVLALMPQVIMMAKSGGKVETPVAEFVAVTTIARCGDLLYSLVFLHELSHMAAANSYWLTVFVQIVHLVLVADFMYYFCKARAGQRQEFIDLEVFVEV